LLLFLITIFKHINAFDPSWHKFKNYVTLEITLLRTQPFRQPFTFTHHCGSAASRMSRRQNKRISTARCDPSAHVATAHSTRQTQEL